jgi:sterol desaturase/sphingolipid hydroxylase (fatty acid hydroxylase superfamily)
MKIIALKLIHFLFRPPNPFWYEACFALIDMFEFCLAIYYGVTIVKLILVFILGTFSWLLAEYLIHRFIFHYRSDSVIIRKIVYAIHGVHHAYPKDHDRLYVPFVPALFMKAVLVLVFYVIWGWLGICFVAGLVTMHQFYNLIHYFIHANTFPNNVFLNRLRANHFKHHKGYSDKCFGVTSTLFDRVFGTHI